MYRVSVQVWDKTTSTRAKDTTRQLPWMILDSASMEEQTLTEQVRSVGQIPVGGSSVTVSGT